MKSNFSTFQEVAVTTAIGTTPEILYGEYAGGMIHIPSGSSITSLTWYSSHKSGGDFEAAMHSEDEHVTPITYVATVQTVAADKAYPIPQELVGSPVLKVVGNAAGTIYLGLKSS